MGRAPTVENLPFSALITHLASTVGFLDEDDDKSKTLSLEPSITMAPSISALPPSATTSQAPLPIYQLVQQLFKKINRAERCNKRRYEYLKKLIGCSNPPPEEPDSPKTTLDYSGKGDQAMDVEAPPHTILRTPKARNEGRDLAREGNEIIHEASKWSPELAAACEVWKAIKFEFPAMDTL
ncbi:hypothetical protein HN873_026633 [Arachis hypogaea]